MRRTSALLLALALAGLSAGCGGDTATNNSGATRNGVIETNANIPANANARTVPSNTAVVTNDNGNENTAGVKTTNSTGNTSGKNTNGGH